MSRRVRNTKEGMLEVSDSAEQAQSGVFNTLGRYGMISHWDSV